MPTQIAPMLAVPDASAAIDFYQAAFNAVIVWHLDRAVAEMTIDGARFFLSDESPQYGTRSPVSAGFTTIRIELFVDDPVAFQQRAIAAGAVELDPVREHTYPTTGPRPLNRMLQGSVTDPAGHRWLIGKILD